MAKCEHKYNPVKILIKMPVYPDLRSFVHRGKEATYAFEMCENCFKPRKIKLVDFVEVERRGFF